jgi:YD repeat-containing protein
MLPDGSADSTGYDRAGNLITHTDRNGLRREVRRDALHRLTALRVDPTALAPDASFSGATSYRAK